MRDEQIINDSAHDLSGVVLKDKFICHLVYEHDFIEHFNNMIACSFDWQEHVFIVYNKIAWDSSKRYNLKNSYYITSFDDDHVSFLLERSSQIVVHCLHTHDLTDYLYRNGHLLYKTNWLLWGADFYLYRCPGTDINPIENEAKRRCIIKRLGYITVSFKEEYDLAIQVYGGNAQYRFGFYPQPIDFPQYPPAPRKRRKRQTRNILVGNSGWPSSNHEQAFSVLSRFRDKDIRVFCPLSYGIPEYIEKVCAIGKETFGDKFVPLRKFIRPDRYLKLLNSMDLVVMNHDRQQAAGNIISSLFLRKKVYMKPHITTYRSLGNLGVSIYDIGELSVKEFDDVFAFPEETGFANSEIIEATYSWKNCVESWGSVFTEALEQKVCAPPSQNVSSEMTSEACTFMAKAALANGRLEEAETLLNEALSHDPDAPQTLHQLALLRHSQGDTRHALKIMDRAVRLAPQDAEMVNDLGALYYLSGNIDKALHFLDKAVGLDQSLLDARKNLAELLEKKGRHKEAEKHYLAILNAYPDDTDAIGGLNRVRSPGITSTAATTLEPSHTPTESGHIISRGCFDPPQDTRQRLLKQKVERILFVNHNLYPFECSGTPLSTRNHALGIHKKGLDVAVLIPDPTLKGSFKKEISADGLTTYIVPGMDRYSAYLSTHATKELDEFTLAIEQIIEDFRPQIVHINDYVYMPAQIVETFSRMGCIVVREVCNCEELCHQNYPVIPSGKKVQLCSGPDAPQKCATCLSVLPGGEEHTNAKSFRLLETAISERFDYVRRLYQASVDMVIFTSEPFKSFFTKFVPMPDDKVRVIPRGFDFPFPRITTRNTPKDGNIHFAFVGNIMFSKGIDVALGAFERISSEQGFVFHVYGHVIDREYSEWLDRLQSLHKDRFVFHGPYSQDDLPSIASAIDVCIVPSYFDTYNRVIREFLYLGVPVITTDFFGAHIIENGINGYRVPVGDAEALSAKMLGLIRNPSLLERLARGASQTHIPTLDEEVDALFKTYQDLYSRLPGKRMATSKIPASCKRDPDSPKRNIVSQELIQRAKAAFDEGRHEEAKKLAHEALSHDPDDADAFHLLGLISHRKDDIEQAVTYLEKALSLAPDNAEYTNDLGTLHYLLRDHEKALSLFQRAVNLDRQMIDARKNLADLLASAGRYKEAERHYRAILRQNPDDNDSRQALERIGKITQVPPQTSPAARREMMECTSRDNGMPCHRTVRLIAFYLPQFHPIPENDRWWGKGFTEWTNVAKARPLFPGHYQPHLPADLGFYDLRLPEARKAQAELAKEYGIHGFCYYHYWFNGKLLLERPLEEVLRTGEPDFPFCICWANENWTRSWDGGDDQILIEQNYGEKDDIDHIRYLCKFFKDPRYIRIDGKPLFLVYRANLLPDPRKTAEVWREEARKIGVGDIYLCRVESFVDERNDPASLGFDAAVEFQPDWKLLTDDVRDENVPEGIRACRYDKVVEKMLEKEIPPYRRFPCVTPN